MTERERLIELLDTVKLWDTNNDYIADYLLKNGVIVPPCKVGDTVWYIKTLQEGTNRKVISDGEIIREISTNGHDMTLLVNCFQVLHCKDLGKTVFFTREEAEKALKEIDKNA